MFDRAVYAGKSSYTRKNKEVVKVFYRPSGSICRIRPGIVADARLTGVACVGLAVIYAGAIVVDAMLAAVIYKGLAAVVYAGLVDVCLLYTSRCV